MSEVSMQMLDIRSPKLHRQHHLQISGGAVWAVIAAVQDAIFQNEGVPLREEGTSLFRVVP